MTGTTGLLVAAAAVEARKARGSRVLLSAGGLLVVGVAVLSGMIMWAARNGDEAVVAKLGPEAAGGDWASLVDVALQVVAAGAVLAFGVGLSWLHGREFADGTVTGLFGLPVGRGHVGLAKAVVHLGWATATSAVLPVGLLVAGTAAGLGVPDGGTVEGLLRVAALSWLSCLVAAPAGVAAVLGRGLLPGIAATVCLLVVAQVSVLAGQGRWSPLSAPALWALDPGGAAPWGVVTSVATAGLATAVTALLWRRLRLDR